METIDSRTVSKSRNCHELMLTRYIYAVRNHNENQNFKNCELSTLLWVHWPTGSAWLSHSPSLISWSPFCHRLVIGRVACFKQLSLSYKFSDKWKRKFYSQSINEMKQVREPNYLVRSKRQLQFNLTTYNTPYQKVKVVTIFSVTYAFRPITDQRVLTYLFHEEQASMSFYNPPYQTLALPAEPSFSLFFHFLNVYWNTFELFFRIILTLLNTYALYQDTHI